MCHTDYCSGYEPWPGASEYNLLWGLTLIVHEREPVDVLEQRAICMFLRVHWKCCEVYSPQEGGYYVLDMPLCELPLLPSRQVKQYFHLSLSCRAD